MRLIQEALHAVADEPPAPAHRCRGIPYIYTLEGDVEDVSRQHIANRASAVVLPAPWYVGGRRVDFFVEQKNGLKSELVVAGLDGAPVAGVPVEFTLTREFGGRTRFQRLLGVLGGGSRRLDRHGRDPVGARPSTGGRGHRRRHQRAAPRRHGAGGGAPSHVR